MSLIINVCLAIKCPYAYKTSPKSSSGCRKYSDARNHCHLVRGRHQIKEQSTEYFLNSSLLSEEEIAQLKIQNDSFLLDCLENRESLQAEVKFGNKILYSPYDEKTFDLAAYASQP